MLRTVVVIFAAAIPAAPAEQFDFSLSYVVWVGSDNRTCNYFLTDAGESAEQLISTLQENYEKAARIEILTDKVTPKGCADIGMKAAQKAGFKHVRIRRGTDKDRSSGIP